LKLIRGNRDSRGIVKQFEILAVVSIV